VVQDPAVKRKIREAAEGEERESYQHRMPVEWLEALAPLGTDWHKEFLEVAPYLIVVFSHRFRVGGGRGGRPEDQTLLRAGIGWNRNRISSGRPPP